MRLRRRFEEGEFETRRANGEGVLGGPPTSNSWPGSAATSSAVCMGKLALLALDALEFRRLLGGGMGEGIDMFGEEGQPEACHASMYANGAVKRRSGRVDQRGTDGRGWVEAGPAACDYITAAAARWHWNGGMVAGYGTKHARVCGSCWGCARARQCCPGASLGTLPVAGLTRAWAITSTLVVSADRPPSPLQQPCRRGSTWKRRLSDSTRPAPSLLLYLVVCP
jgi:hypothetical protein